MAEIVIVDDEEKIDYHNTGFVNWLGVFAQDMLTNEHTVEKVSEDFLQKEVKTITKKVSWLDIHTGLESSIRRP